VIDREIGDRRGEGADLGNLGVAYKSLNDMQRAIGYYEQQFEIAREIGDRVEEGNALGNLGNAYKILGDIQQAIGYFEQALAINRETGNRQGEALVSWNLGLAFEKNGETEKAIMALDNCVNFERAIGHPDAEKDAKRVNRLRAQVQGESPIQVNPTQVAFEAFQRVESLQEMQVAANQHIMLKDSQFIQAIAEIIKEQVPPNQKAAFEQRLSWLRQVTGK